MPFKFDAAGIRKKLSVATVATVALERYSIWSIMGFGNGSTTQILNSLQIMQCVELFETVCFEFKERETTRHFDFVERIIPMLSRSDIWSSSIFLIGPTAGPDLGRASRSKRVVVCSTAVKSLESIPKLYLLN